MTVSKPQPKYGWRGSKFEIGARVKHRTLDLYGTIVCKGPRQWLRNETIWLVDFDHGGKNYAQAEGTLRVI